MSEKTFALQTITKEQSVFRVVIPFTRERKPQERFYSDTPQYENTTLEAMVTINQSGNVTIERVIDGMPRDCKYTFIQSDPSVLAAVAELLQTAKNISEKVKNGNA